MVPAIAKVSNDALVQPDKRQMRNTYKQLFYQQLRCNHVGDEVFRTPAGNYRCIDVNQCALKSKSITDNSVLEELANKERKLRAKYNVLYNNKASDYLDSDNEFTTVTKKRKRRFNWSLEKKSHHWTKNVHSMKALTHRLHESPDSSKASSFVKKDLFKKMKLSNVLP